LSNVQLLLGLRVQLVFPVSLEAEDFRLKFENEALFYSDGFLARTEDGKRIIRKGDFLLRENDNLFVPALWNKKEIIAYSRSGYESRSWQLPEDWHDVKSFDLYKITMEGCIPFNRHVQASDAKLVLSLEKDEAISIVPAGKMPAGVIRQLNLQ